MILDGNLPKPLNCRDNMQAFDAELTQRVIFGKNSIEKLGELTRALLSLIHI